ncbi:hypothetical protein MMPV_005646 [Pyropia vietnamensis]
MPSVAAFLAVPATTGGGIMEGSRCLRRGAAVSGPRGGVLGRHAGRVAAGGHCGRPPPRLVGWSCRAGAPATPPPPSSPPPPASAPPPAASTPAAPGWPPALLRLLDRVTTLFPLWVMGAAAVGAAHPPALAWFTSNMVVTITLSLIMFGMGLSLPLSDVAAAVARPRIVLFGAAAQFLLMPSLGWALVTAAGSALPPTLALGVLLVACCPGGAASNLVVLLSGGDVALSVLMTLATTLAAAAGVTPALTRLLAGTLVPVPAGALLASTVQMVLAPLAVGVTAQRLAPATVRAVLPATAPGAVLGVAAICGGVLATNAAAVSSLPAGVLPVLVGVLTALHGGGLVTGYAVARWVGKLPRRAARAVAVEVCMQNSGLAAALAGTHFPGIAALPAALSASLHSLMGAAVAAWWHWRDRRQGVAAAEQGGGGEEGA